MGDKKVRIEYGDNPYRSAFDPRNLPKEVAAKFKDKGTDLRWADPRKVDEHKNSNGYKTVAGASSDGTTKVKGMILMERDRTLADESRKRKEYRTRQQAQATREMLRNEAERLSRQTGQDVHRLINEDKDS